MTPQEKQLLERFLADMAAARAGQKDPEAETLIRDAMARQPDAAYLLVQRALQLDQVLQMREAEVQKLQCDLEQAKSGGSAGGGFLGDPYAWGSRGGHKAPQGAAPIPGVKPGAAQPRMAAQQAAPQGQQQPAARPWGGGGMLGTVASTAAGVVAGSFLFQGIQNLMNRNEPQAGAGDKAQTAHEPSHADAQPLVSDSSGFDSVVPEDSEMYAAGDDGDIA